MGSRQGRTSEHVSPQLREFSGRRTPRRASAPRASGSHRPDLFWQWPSLNMSFVKSPHVCVRTAYRLRQSQATSGVNPRVRGRTKVEVELVDPMGEPARARKEPASTPIARSRRKVNPRVRGRTDGAGGPGHYSTGEPARARKNLVPRRGIVTMSGEPARVRKNHFQPHKADRGSG